MSNEQKPSVEGVQRYRLIGHDSDLETDPDGELVKHSDALAAIAAAEQRGWEKAREAAARCVEKQYLREPDELVRGDEGWVAPEVRRRTRQRDAAAIRALAFPPDQSADASKKVAGEQADA